MPRAIHERRARAASSSQFKNGLRLAWAAPRPRDARREPTKELVRRGARAERILVLSAKDRPCRAAESYGMATAFLGGGEDDYVGLDEAWDPAL